MSNIPEGFMRDFFTRYQTANIVDNSEALAGFYADVFMFSGVQGAFAINKEDFKKLIPRRKDMLKEKGLMRTHFRTVKTSQIDAWHILAEVSFDVEIKSASREVKTVPAHATYILRYADGGARIVFQIDHQDLLRLLEENSK